MTLVLTCGDVNARPEAAHALLVAAGLGAATAPTARPSAAVAPAGWAEAHAPGRLEALATAQPELRFVLVYASPQAVLAQGLQGRAAEPGVVGEVLVGWLATHDDLLRFANRHPSRCVLVDAACAQHAPHAFVAHVAETFQLPLQASAEPPRFEPDATASLASVLAQALVQGRRDVAALLLELHSQATLDPTTLGVAQHEHAQAWQQLADLQADRHAQARRAAQEAATRLAEETQRSAATRQEGELLLAQLHQVQEELEATFLKSQETAKARDALQAEHQAALAANASQAAKWQAEQKALQDKLAQSSRAADERNAELAKLRAERDQLSAAAQQHKTQAEALKQEADKQKAELQRRPDPAPLQAQLAEATQENELLLLQLHHVQEELEHYFLQHRELAARTTDDAPLLRFLQGQWQAAQPEEIVIDLRHDVPGRNWHDIEPDGRWAGPATTSQLRWPALKAGTYNLALDIVDAMHADILQGTELHLNGQRIETELLFDGFPALLMANVTMPDVPEGWWELELRFPRVMAPAERGEPDERQLALRVRGVRVTLLEAA